MPRTLRLLSLIPMLLIAGTSGAQQSAWGVKSDGEWHFARLVYKSAEYRSSFATDYPEAEIHLRQGLGRLTRIDIGGDTFIELDDDDIMNYPWLYAVEVGRWYLDDRDAALIREYLLRGGFLMVDDFWGSRQWQIFEDSMRRVFPDRPIVEIDESDPLMSLVYELDKSIQIPGVSYFRSGVTWQQDGYVPYWRGIYDDDGRLMVAINFNMDLGDAWEHADDPRYPEAFTGLAYRFAVNYAIYSMTH
ncbi:MAG TPA: DUF4159 domain-containing protein [Gammaproteobacteria bacterium]|nr:DUF4159 domain-containing protein [Gammaproteobacteria bacterium]